MADTKTKTDAATSPLMLGVNSIIIGALAQTFYQPTALCYGLYGVGIASIVGHYFWPRNKWRILFENCKMVAGKPGAEKYPQLQEKKKTNYGHCLAFKVPLGLSSEDFRKNQAAIEEFLNAWVEIKYYNKMVYVEVYEMRVSKDVAFTLPECKGILQFPVGASYKGLETVDLNDGSPHMLIAGETGSGKSTVLRAIITFLIMTKSPRMLQLDLIDLKRGAELGLFRKCEMVRSFSRDAEEAEETLQAALKEVERRYDLFADAECVDIKEYNAKHKQKLPYRVIIVDEFAELKKEKESLGAVERLAALARACGVHLILSTQRPSATVINGDIKANVPLVLGLKTMNYINSQIIIGRKGLEELRGKGHGILQHNGLETEIQGMNLPPQDARDLVKTKYRAQADAPAPKAPEKKPDGEVKEFDFLQVLK